MSNTQSGMIGALLTDALVIKRGHNWVVQECCCKKNFPPITPSNVWHQVTIKGVDNVCSHKCVMFDEPVWYEDGSASIEICHGRILRFSKLYSFRGDNTSISQEDSESVLMQLANAGIVDLEKTEQV